MEVVGAAASAEASLTVRIFKTRTSWRMGDERSIMGVLMKYIVEYMLEGEGEVILEGRIYVVKGSSFLGVQIARAFLVLVTYIS